MGLVYMICRRLALLAIGYFFVNNCFFLSIRSFTLRIYSASQRQPISIHRLVVYNYTCVVARSHVKLRTNSQHCWANNVGSCCVRVCSGLQTHAKIPNIVGQQCWELVIITCGEIYDECNYARPRSALCGLI